MPGLWELTDNPPVSFLRSNNTRALAKPLSGSDIKQLWEFINIPEQGQLLCLAWIIDCWRTDTPFPILELIGEQGSAKSTTQEMLRKLIDPSSANLRASPTNCQDVFVNAGINWLVSYENISHLSLALQDTLCVIATGGGHAKRKLYTDKDESIIMVKRPIILNGISGAVTAQDLVDRTISIELPIINNRKETNEIWPLFQENEAMLLGALLDIAAKALNLLPTIQLPPEEKPRLVEFVRLGCAIAKVVGKTENDFLQQFNINRLASIERALETNPVALALINWFEANQRRPKTLPTKDLLQSLESYKPLHAENWPRLPRGFTDTLRRVALALRQIGIECRCLGKMAGHFLWEIKPRT